MVATIMGRIYTMAIAGNYQVSPADSWCLDLNGIVRDARRGSAFFLDGGGHTILVCSSGLAPKTF